MRLPHEKYIRWLITCGDTNEHIRARCHGNALYFNPSTFYSYLDEIREEMDESGGKTYQKRLENKNGHAKPLSDKMMQKVVGSSIDISDPKTMGSMDTLLRVRPARRAIQIMSAKKMPPEIISHELKMRFDMAIEPDLIDTFCEYFWDVPEDSYTALYDYIQCIPEEDDDKEFFTTCLGKPIQYVFWKLGLNSSMQWNEGETMVQFMAGASQHLINSLDPTINTSGKAPSAWLSAYEVAREIYYDWQQRNTDESTHTVVEQFHERIKLNRGQELDIPEISNLENVG